MEKINGRTPEEIKRWLRWATYRCERTEDRCATCEYRDDCGEYCGSDTHKEALAYIEQLEVALKCKQVARTVLMEDMPRWISVKERLPEHRQHVYACAKDKFRFEGIYIDPVGFERYEIGEGWVNENQNVTHWMPMPESPEEDAHE